MKGKRAVFFGFGNLGKECLSALIKNGWRVEQVFSNKGPNNEALLDLCRVEQIGVFLDDPRKNLETFTSLLKIDPVDFMISVNYRNILPKEIFRLSRFAFNLHGSLLPKYRGRTPHVWSIINGEKTAGITSHLIEEKVDAGDIILQKEVPIGAGDTGQTLLKKYEQLYPGILLETLELLAQGKPLVKQDETKASYFGKRIPEMGYIDFFKQAEEIVNFVRAQSKPYPGAYYYLADGRKIVIHRVVRATDKEGMPLDIGLIEMIGGRYYARCKDGVLELTDCEIEQ